MDKNLHCSIKNKISNKFITMKFYCGPRSRMTSVIKRLHFSSTKHKNDTYTL